MRIRTIVKIVALAIAAVGVALATLIWQFDAARYKPEIARWVQDATGRKLEIAGELRLGLSLTPTLIAEGVHFQNAIHGTRPEMIKARRVEAQVAVLPLLRGRIEVRRLVLIGPDILLETDERGRHNWNFAAPGSQPGGAAATADSAFALPQLGAVAIHNGLLTHRDGRTGQTTKFEVVRFSSRAPDRDSPIAFNLEAAFNGVPFRAGGRLGSFAALESAGDFAVDLQVESDFVDGTLKGHLRRPLAPAGGEFAVKLSGEALNDWTPLVKTPLPARPYQLEGRLAWRDRAATASDLHVRLGGSSLSGHVRLDLSGARPAVAAAISAQRLDLADLRAEVKPPRAKAPRATTAGKATDGRVFAAAPIDVAGLRAFDGKIELHVRQFVADGVTLADLEGTATVAAGVATLEPFAARLADGSVKGRAVVDASQPIPRLHAAIDGSRIDLAALLRPLAGTDVMTGHADVAIDAIGQGDSLRALMASLSGRASLVVGPGRVHSGYVDLLGADLLRFAASAGAANASTQVNCLVARFDLAKGVAKANGLLFDTERMTVRGEGHVDLAAERLALTFTPRPNETSLFSLATPWRVEGTLADPSVALDEAGLAARAAGTVLSVVNPLMLLVPVVTSTLGGEANPCVEALKLWPGQSPAPPPRSGVGRFFDTLLPTR